MKLLPVTVGAIAAVLLSSVLNASASKGDGHVGELWLPLHVPSATEKWVSANDGQPVWSVMYAKQYDQVAFRLCGYWQGHGEALLAYPEAGDPVLMDFDVPTAMCITTPVDVGGGDYAHPLQVYLRSELPHSTRALTVRSPNVFVLTR